MIVARRNRTVHHEEYLSVHVGCAGSRVPMPCPLASELSTSSAPLISAVCPTTHAAVLAGSPSLFAFPSTATTYRPLSRQRQQQHQQTNSGHRADGATDAGPNLEGEAASASASSGGILYFRTLDLMVDHQHSTSNNFRPVRLPFPSRRRPHLYHRIAPTPLNTEKNVKGNNNNNPHESQNEDHSTSDDNDDEDRVSDERS